MNACRRLILPAGVLTLALLLTACVQFGKGTQQPTRLYLLAAKRPDAAAPAIVDAGDRAIGVGPLTFPAYLNRSHIVARSGPHELLPAPFALWAAPLDENFLRVLAENLALLTKSKGVHRHPWAAERAPQVQLHVTVDRFDAARGGDAVLVVRWVWRDPRGMPLMPPQHSVFIQPVAGDGDDALVAALSRLVETFSRAAAGRLGRLTP